MNKGLFIIEVIAWVNVVAVLVWFGIWFFRRRM